VEKINQSEISNDLPFEHHFSPEEIQKRLALLAMDWDSLSDEQKLIAVPGLGYN